VEILFNHDAATLYVVEISNWYANGSFLEALKRALVSRNSNSGLDCVYTVLVLEIDGYKLLQLALEG
jgi:hypothetical protein